MTVTREYFTQEGEPIDPATVAQNTRLVVVLSASLKKPEVKPAQNGTEPANDGEDDGEEDESDTSRSSGNFLMVDRLPAGLEIENPHLIGSGYSGALPSLSDLTGVEHLAFRDDRFAPSFSG